MVHVIGMSHVVDKNLNANCMKAFGWGSGSFDANRYMGINGYQ